MNKCVSELQSKTTTVIDTNDFYRTYGPNLNTDSYFGRPFIGNDPWLPQLHTNSKATEVIVGSEGLSVHKGMVTSCIVGKSVWCPNQFTLPAGTKVRISGASYRFYVWPWTWRYTLKGFETLLIDYQLPTGTSGDGYILSRSVDNYKSNN